MLDDDYNQRHCVKCGKIGGILTCDGCSSTFCSRHAMQHRQELTYQLETILQDHDLIQQNLERSLYEHSLLQKIARWEKESIRKIRTAADTARVDLRQITDKSKRQLARMSRDIAADLNSSSKADDFSEKDLVRWMKQLNTLRLDIKSSYSIEIMEDQRFPIYPITVSHNKFQNIHKKNPNPAHMSSDDGVECFFKATNAASIENNGTIIKHIGPDLDVAHIIGKKFYSHGRHTARFKIQQLTRPYSIFFGCISSSVVPEVLTYKSSSVVGWFGYNEIYQHGVWNNNANVHGYDSYQFDRNDVVNLTLDCDQQRLELFHERFNKTHKLSVDIDQAPFPWQILVVLTHEDDCVKILPKR
ncbi:unnamed protein product [Rotaria socialis]|uniref:B box-type domain-containing protein n=3 Tax=Rotaria socialis TaxID=392032 RepID=A0A820TB30_9BILA|nr:unnamed protein product [Rotaria socialis]CAF3641740.1 unnamed protein product [Rotaria socialis]CAF3732223.1 unnamed protein product [Rotaria socialis]CAF4466288.1 unnamed protein product [Rotaria socialis]CAF4668228.1 unnamed protein product [Rotaria socialis]